MANNDGLGFEAGQATASDIRERAVTQDDIRAELSFIESFISDISGTDDFLEAVLQSQRTQLLLSLQQARFSGGLPPGEEEVIEIGDRALPVDSIGIAARDIQHGDNGPAVFQLNGGRFKTEIRADEDIPSGDPVVIIGTDNLAELATDAGSISTLFSERDPDTFVYEGELRTPPRVVDREQDIKVENQTYTRGDYQSVSTDLNPGQQKEFARVEVEPGEFFLFKYTYASSIQTAEYEYYFDNSDDPDPDLSGSTPLASPPDKAEVVPNGFIIVDRTISLQITETSGNTSYSDVTAGISGLKMEV